MPTYTYADCVANSRQVYWNLDAAVAGLRFDFTKRLLPERIAGVDSLHFLSETEKLALNQIRGHSYAHLFLFVEEFIIPQVMDQAMDTVHNDPTATTALLRFAEEELKHQELFDAVKAALVRGLGIDFQVVGGRVEVANTVRSFGPLAVMLLTSMLEWITQRHFLECFRGDRSQLDPSYVEVFRLHWVEEAQHAKLDTLELQRMSVTASPTERAKAVDDLMSLCGAFDAILSQQTELDIDTLQTHIGRAFTAAERTEMHSKQLAAYRWTFLVSGLDHPVFRAVVTELSPPSVPKLDDAIAMYGEAA